MLCEQPLELCDRTAVIEYRKQHNRDFTTGHCVVRCVL
jgi:hypothetical protein